MKREIKFRAWDISRKKMINVEEIDFVQHRITWDSGIVSAPIFNHPIMQFIGLKDNSNKEIYEGDILLNEGGMRDIWICEFHSGGFIFRLPLKDMEDHIEYAGVPSGFKVLGNIYENPELLGSHKTNYTKSEAKNG